MTRRCLVFLPGLAFTLVATLISPTAFGDPPRGLGDLGVPGGYSASPFPRAYDTDRLPSSFDWRDIGPGPGGILGPVADQGLCGSSWAFTALAVARADLWIKYRPLINIDPSEQEWISCIPDMDCCGGDLSALQRLSTHPLLDESCTGYAETATQCPGEDPPVECTTVHNMGCASFSWPFPAQYLAVDTTDLNEIKRAIYFDGISYARFDVPGNFFSYFFQNPPTDEPYVVPHPPFTVAGGHAVQLIGWDDDKPSSDGTGALLCRNSWGEGGPNSEGDGTFWLAYSAIDQLDFAVVTLRKDAQGTQCTLSGETSKDWTSGQMRHDFGDPQGDAWLARCEEENPCSPVRLSYGVLSNEFGAGSFDVCVSLQGSGDPDIITDPVIELEVEDEEADEKPNSVTLNWGQLAGGNTVDLCYTVKNPCFAIIHFTVTWEGPPDTTILHSRTYIRPAEE
jgi:hypothetical protein